MFVRALFSHYKSVLHTNKFKVASYLYEALLGSKSGQIGKIMQSRRPFRSKTFSKT